MSLTNMDSESFEESSDCREGEGPVLGYGEIWSGQQVPVQGLSAGNVDPVDWNYWLENHDGH